MPDFLFATPCAASCQVRPSEPSWCSGSSSRQVSKTVATFGSCQDASPFISCMWKS